MDASQIFPTKGNLLAAKKSHELATLGFSLMDRKRNILIREMMGMIDHAKELRTKIDETYKTAYKALEAANITLGICESVAQSVPIEKSLEVSARSVMGVELPIVRIENEALRPCYDLSSTNSDFDQAYLSFHEVKVLTADLAEVENCVYRLAVAIKKTQSRANALKNIILPNQEFTIKFITDALEEKEREEFSRLKVIKNTKKKRRATDR